MSVRRPAAALVLSAALAGSALAACGSDGGGEASPVASGADGAAGPGSCAAAGVRTVVSVEQWADIVGQLAGPCGDVTTIVSGSSVDPHDYELSPADATAFDGAELVVVNGLDYDHWAEDAVDAAGGDSVVVDAGAVVGGEEGDNPHLWYSPDDVEAMADAVTAALSTLRPEAASQFGALRASFGRAIAPYLDEVAAVKAVSAGRTFAATESVFDLLGEELGLTNVTPEGYQRAAANESDPGPADLAAFEQALRDGSVDVLVLNVQTQGAVPDQLRSMAEAQDVPVVEVTETVAPDASGFVDWQVAQLQRLAEALG